MAVLPRWSQRVERGSWGWGGRDWARAQGMLMEGLGKTGLGGSLMPPQCALILLGIREGRGLALPSPVPLYDGPENQGAQVTSECCVSYVVSFRCWTLSLRTTESSKLVYLVFSDCASSHSTYEEFRFLPLTSCWM